MQWVSRAKKASDGPSGIAFVAYEPEKKAVNVMAGVLGGGTHGALLEDSEPPDTCVLPLDEVVMSCCEEVLNQGFEAVVGLALGRYGCPFLCVDLRLDVNYADYWVKENRHHVRGEYFRFATFPGA
jgi:hypothetical protein